MKQISRREFTKNAAVAGIAATGTLSRLRAEDDKPKQEGKAKACIFLWLGGGMCHVDTFDPKRVGDPKEKKAGSAYDSIPTAIEGVRVCQHLKRTADIMDRAVLMRSLTHELSQLHAEPTNLFKTGRPISGTIVYPSIGSLVSHELGPREEGVPPYIVMGYPNVTRGPGFLGSKYSYIYLTDTESGPAGIRRPQDVTEVRQRRRIETLNRIRRQFAARNVNDSKINNYNNMIDEAFRMAGPKFTNVFDLTKEVDKTRNRYGDEFGQRCLLARRLIEHGVRFVDVSFNLNFLNGTGWDTHGAGQENQHKLIQGLDQSLTALIEDLDNRKLLDTTLVVVATEFGRPPEFDGAGGRGHHSKAFSTVLFGGGVKSGHAIGQTDEMGKAVVDRPITLPDWHATIHAAMGVDPSKELFAGDRPVPITDHGRPIPEVFS